MPIFFDTTGLSQVDENTWVDHRTGDGVLVGRSSQIPDLPPFLHDPPRMLRQLAIDTATATDRAPAGVLIEANVIQVDSLPAVYQLVKTPIPNRDRGMAYIASVTIPRAHCSVTLSMQAMEGERTGVRETMVASEIIYADGGPQRLRRPHPYAGDVPHLWFDEPDDLRWDAQWPDHPLTRARTWAYRNFGAVRLDPRFAQLPPFPPRQGVAVPRPPAPPALTGQLSGGPVTVLPGVPVGDLISLNHDDGGSSFWRMTDPTVALARLALGELDRVDPTGRGARETAVLDPSTRTLRLGAGVTGVIPVNPADALNNYDDDGIRTAFAVITDRALRAAIRGEALTVGLDGWRPPAVPNFLLTARFSAEGWQAYLHVTPIPVFVTEWRGHPVVGDGQVFSAPGLNGEDSGMAQAINLALYATYTWGAHPLQLAMSFIPHPDPQPPR
jgi:hypothetical protein